MKAQFDLQTVANENIPIYLRGREAHNELYVHFSTQAHRHKSNGCDPVVVTRCEGWNMTTEALATLIWTW